MRYEFEEIYPDGMTPQGFLEIERGSAERRYPLRRSRKRMKTLERELALIAKLDRALFPHHQRYRRFARGWTRQSCVRRGSAATCRLLLSWKSVSIRPSINCYSTVLSPKNAKNRPISTSI
jgi:hypothetical protein